MKKSIIASVLAISATFSVQAKDIVDTAVAAGSFKTLATALTAAGLIDTLKGLVHSLCLHRLMQRLQKFQRLI